MLEFHACIPGLGCFLDFSRLDSTSFTCIFIIIAAAAVVVVWKSLRMYSVQVGLEHTALLALPWPSECWD